MSQLTLGLGSPGGMAQRSPRVEELAAASRRLIYLRTDGWFAHLLLFQWAAAVCLALWVSPYTWAGTASQPHQHVWAAFFLGGGIIALPLALIHWLRGEAITRHTIAMAQMLMGALLIHLCGGRIETHFHVFGSLAFLAFYRDWRVLLTGTVIVAADHFLRGMFWPLSIFGTSVINDWRWLEHAGWVVFEDLFLVRSCLQGTHEIYEIAEKQAAQEQVQAGVEDMVAQRTRELRLSEARKTAVLEASLDCLITIDYLGRIVELNPAVESTFGYRREEILGKELAPLFFPPVAQTPGQAGFMKAGQVVPLSGRIELSARRADGSVFPAELTVTPIRTDEQALFTACLRDITVHKNAEFALCQAKEAAESANRAKSEFLANMSHEIRTPMNGILGMTELALDTELSSEQREYLESVRFSGQALLKVINDILDFSKIEAGKLDLENIDFDLRDTLGNTMKSMTFRANDAGIELAYEVPPHVPNHLVGDPTRLRQVLVNLVGNAMKFTEKGEVVVAVNVVKSSPSEAQLHFTVRDTGIGIAADKQALIFEPFAQADGTTTRRYGGTGLGLSISTQLIEMMGGEIWLDSELGVGSTFHFTAKFSVKAAPATQSAMIPLKLRDVRVLIVDDNATNRRILNETLLHWEMKPTAVDGGPAALAAMQQAADAGKPFRLMLLDAMMPDMDGFMLAERIKQNPAHVHLTIMMLTSANQRGDIARCRELGMSAYLIKPVQQSDLLGNIMKALRVSAETHTAACPSVAQPALGQGLNILLAEDNVVNQQVAVRMLQKQGHRIKVANNGKEVLVALEKQTFDLVLMDVQMPEMGGFETTEVIRKWEKGTTRHLPIIAMTAHAMKGDRERCLAIGMDGYVAKPVQAQELREAIETIFTPSVGAGRSTSALEPVHAALDETALLARVDGDRLFLCELATLFLDDCPRHLAAIREALARNDAEELHRASHTLKGAVGNFCAAAAFQACLRLETLGRSGDLTCAASAFIALELAIQRLRTALYDLIQQPASACPLPVPAKDAAGEIAVETTA